jgi:dTDP-4-dehydrorhamnose reductase
MKIVVLGSTGMLGSEVFRVATNAGCQVIGVSRSNGHLFDVSTTKFAQLAHDLSLGQGDYLVNCIGWIPQKSSGILALDEMQAELLNVSLPGQINESAENLGFQWIQIGTDCVFDGAKGGYSESSSKNALDLYGQTKIRGEDLSSNAFLIRASIVGPDLRSSSGLYSWFKNELALGHLVTGFENHIWNGVTTTAFARLAVGLASSRTTGSLVAHWLPSDKLSKLDLLRLFAGALGSSPAAAVKSGSTEKAIDRTLSTDNPLRNTELWRTAGYGEVPHIAELVTELVRRDTEREAE